LAGASVPYRCSPVRFTEYGRLAGWLATDKPLSRVLFQEERQRIGNTHGLYPSKTLRRLPACPVPSHELSTDNKNGQTSHPPAPHLRTRRLKTNCVHRYNQMRKAAETKSQRSSPGPLPPHRLAVVIYPVVGKPMSPNHCRQVCIFPGRLVSWLPRSCREIEQRTGRTRRLGCGRARLAEVGFVDFAVSMLPAVCFFWEMVMSTQYLHKA
jgi:hypothetical protein